MRVHIVDLHLCRASDFNNAITLSGFTESGRNRAENNTYIASHRQALDCFLITLRSPHLYRHRFIPLQNCQISIFNLHKESLARFQLFGVLIFFPDCRTHLFQRSNRTAVMPLLEMTKTNIVIGFIHLFGDREIFNHLAHYLKTLAIMSPFKKTCAHLQGCQGPLTGVGIFLVGYSFKMCACLIIGISLS